MTSKEALDILNYECIRSNGTDDEFSKELNLIKKDLEVLEILKSSIVYDEREIGRIKFMELSASIFSDDNINKIKEWLENDLRGKLQN